MALSALNIVAAIEIAVYVPAIICSFTVCSRHGFSRAFGWYYTFTLCLIRIIGAACQLATISNPTSVGLIEAALILERIGLTPLLLATLGMLSRLVDWINQSAPTPWITTKHFRLVQLLVLLSAIFSIVGVTNSTSKNSSNNAGPPDPSAAPSALSDVSVIMYTVVYAALVLILLVSLRSLPLVPDRERIIVPAVCVALPFIAVRLLYQLLVVFVHAGVFVRFGGPIAVNVCMALVEEFIVVAIYLFLGFRLERLEKTEQGPILSRPWKAPRVGRGGRKQRRRERRGERAGVYYERGVGEVEEYPIDEEGGRQHGHGYPAR